MTRITITHPRRILRGSDTQYRLAAVDERSERMLSRLGEMNEAYSSQNKKFGHMLSRAKARLHAVR